MLYGHKSNGKWMAGKWPNIWRQESTWELHDLWLSSSLFEHLLYCGDLDFSYRSKYAPPAYQIVMYYSGSVRRRSPSRPPSPDTFNITRTTTKSDEVWHFNTTIQVWNSVLTFLVLFISGAEVAFEGFFHRKASWSPLQRSRKLVQRSYCECKSWRYHWCNLRWRRSRPQLARKIRAAGSRRYVYSTGIANVSSYAQYFRVQRKRKYFSKAKKLKQISAGMASGSLGE